MLCYVIAKIRAYYSLKREDAAWDCFYQLFLYKNSFNYSHPFFLLFYITLPITQKSLWRILVPLSFSSFFITITWPEPGLCIALWFYFYLMPILSHDHTSKGYLLIGRPFLPLQPRRQSLESKVEFVFSCYWSSFECEVTPLRLFGYIFVLPTRVWTLWVSHVFCILYPCNLMITE